MATSTQEAARQRRELREQERRMRDLERQFQEREHEALREGEVWIDNLKRATDAYAELVFNGVRVWRRMVTSLTQVSADALTGAADAAVHSTAEAARTTARVAEASAESLDEALADHALGRDPAAAAAS